MQNEFFLTSRRCRGFGHVGEGGIKVPSCQVVLVIISGTMKVLSDVDTGVIPRSLISWSFQ